MELEELKKRLTEGFDRMDRVVNDPKQRAKARQTVVESLGLWEGRDLQGFSGPFPNGRNVIEGPSHKRVQKIMEEVREELCRTLSSIPGSKS